MARVLLSGFLMLDALDAGQRSQLRACLLGGHLGAATLSTGAEQSALVLASLIESGGEIEGARASFRRHLLRWCARVPCAVSLGTLRSCVRIFFRRRDSATAQANDEAALRSAVIGACLPYDDARRRALARALARVTHRDGRAIEAAVFTSELAALCARQPDRERASLALLAARAAQHGEVREVVDGAVQLALFKDEAVDLQHDGDSVLDTLRLCVWAFVRHGDVPRAAFHAATAVGGSTAAATALVGSWLGVLHGEQALPHELMMTVNDEHLLGPSNSDVSVSSRWDLRAAHASHGWALTRNLRSLLWWSRAHLLPR
jgi:ADP-ribosylglycohydrolase